MSHRFLSVSGSAGAGVAASRGAGRRPERGKIQRRAKPRRKPGRRPRRRGAIPTFRDSGPPRPTFPCSGPPTSANPRHAHRRRIGAAGKAGAEAIRGR